MGPLLRADPGRGAAGDAPVRDFAAGDLLIANSRTRCESLTGLLGAAALLSSSAFGQTAPASPGYYELGFSTRSFEAPLFGPTSTTAYHLFASQGIAPAGNLTAWLDGGFPNYRTYYGAEADHLPLGAALACVQAGDFSLEPLQPAGSGLRIADAYPIEGLAVRAAGESGSWLLFAGRAAYALSLPARSVDRPILFGGEGLYRFGRDAIGLGIDFVESSDAAKPEGRGSRAVFSARYIRVVSPWASLFGEWLTTETGKAGARLGSQWKFDAGDVTAAAYSYHRDFPFVYPLYRPGEKGIEIRGLLRPSDLSTLYAQVNSIRDDAASSGSNLRASAGGGISLGWDGPYLGVAYSRDEITYETLTPSRQSFFGDRYSLSLDRSSIASSLSVALEHVRNRGGAQVNRSQGVLLYRAAAGASSTLEVSAVVQREENRDFGTTAECAVERPLRGGPYRYLLGLGAAYLDQGGSRSGEGVARIGLVRRLARNGWYGRLEGRIPFSIGLPKSHRNSGAIALDVGTRFGWSDVRGVRNLFAPSLSPSQFGTVEGAALLEGEGWRGLAVLLDGEVRATTGPNGSFRIPGVPVGAHVVTLDIRDLDPRYSVVGGFSRDLLVHPRAVTRVEFRIAPLSTFGGSLVVCRGAGLEPVRGARILLRGQDFLRTVTTTVIGGFEFGDLPPGHYEAEIDPRSLEPGLLQQPLPRLRLDLTHDVRGYVIRLDCAAGP